MFPDSWLASCIANILLVLLVAFLFMRIVSTMGTMAAPMAKGVKTLVTISLFYVFAILGLTYLIASYFWVPALGWDKNPETTETYTSETTPQESEAPAETSPSATNN